MKKKDISVGVTAFIDILGFGDKVLEATSIKNIEQISKNLELIQNAFDFNTEDEDIRETQKMHQTSVLAFSDCVVINIPLESDATSYEGTFDPIMSEITGLAYGQGTCCLNSLFLRGGIDLGWWYQKGSMLISQSMVNAYKTENSACMPVIALTDEFYNYFSEHKHRDFYSKDIDPIAKVFRKFQEGEKEFFYIDYITICLESLGWQTSVKQLGNYRVASPEEKDKIMGQGYRQNVDDWLITHAKNIEAAYAVIECSRVKKKYEWLSLYHNEIAANFTVNKKCLCSI